MAFGKSKAPGLKENRFPFFKVPAWILLVTSLIDTVADLFAESSRGIANIIACNKERII